MKASVCLVCSHCFLSPGKRRTDYLCSDSQSPVSFFPMPLSKWHWAKRHRRLTIRGMVVSSYFLEGKQQYRHTKQTDGFICCKTVYNIAVRLLCRGSLLQPGVWLCEGLFVQVWQGGAPDWWGIPHQEGLLFVWKGRNGKCELRG